jgi:membrane protein implicated in regulation of membrane protease activity
VTAIIPAGTAGLVVPWWTLAGVVPLVLSVVTVVAVESSLRRCERLGEALRVGGA